MRRVRLAKYLRDARIRGDNSLSYWPGINGLVNTFALASSSPSRPYFTGRIRMSFSLSLSKCASRALLLGQGEDPRDPPPPASKFGIIRPLNTGPYFASRKTPLLSLPLSLSFPVLPLLFFFVFFFLLLLFLLRFSPGRKKCGRRECAPWSLTSHTSRRPRRRKRGVVHSYRSLVVVVVVVAVVFRSPFLFLVLSRPAERKEITRPTDRVST